MISTRDAFGEALAEIGNRENIFVLDGDLSDATRTQYFGKIYKDRFFPIGIAEQNMIGVAAGLALSNKIPIVSSFATFCPLRCIDQIRSLIAPNRLNVKIISTHAGITTGADGLSHQAIEDIAIMKALPNFVIVSPADATETKRALTAIIEYEGPVYMRLYRMEIPVLYNMDYDFEIGKGNILREGKDVAIISTGVAVSESLEAAKILKGKGIDASVVNISTIKPIDYDLISKIAKNVNAIITVEDHNIIGGLGSSVADVLACGETKIKFKKLGVQDRFGESGDPKLLIKKHGFDAESIARTAGELL